MRREWIGQRWFCYLHEKSASALDKLPILQCNPWSSCQYGKASTDQLGKRVVGWRGCYFLQQTSGQIFKDEFQISRASYCLVVLSNLPAYRGVFLQLAKCQMPAQFWARPSGRPHPRANTCRTTTCLFFLWVFLLFLSNVSFLCLHMVAKDSLLRCGSKLFFYFLLFNLFAVFLGNSYLSAEGKSG